MSRREDVFRRVARGENRRTPEQQAVRGAIRRLSESPDFAVLLDYLQHLEWTQGAVDDASGDTGALLRAAGRRSLLRELERLGERVTDDDRSDQSG